MNDVKYFRHFSMKNITKLTAHEIREGYKSKEFTAKEVVESFYKNIDENSIMKFLTQGQRTCN